MNWSDILAEEKQKPYFKKILEFLANEALVGKTIFLQKRIYLMLLSILGSII